MSALRLSLDLSPRDLAPADRSQLKTALRARLDAIVATEHAIEAVYTGAREGIYSRAVVYVTDERGRRPLPHLVHHSPAGLSWGYQGAGPADLALSLLHDGAVRALAAQAGREARHPSLVATGNGFDLTDDEVRLAQLVAADLHQRYKTDVVAALVADEPWALAEKAVAGWLEAAL